jgi:glutamine synthetase
VGPGQEEINVRYAEALDMADRHVILKNGIQGDRRPGRQGRDLHGQVQLRLAGNSSHIHNSLWSADGKTAVLRQEGAVDAVELGQQWSAGQLKYAKEFTWFLAPYINSYKRFQSAPSRRPRSCGRKTTARPASGCAAWAPRAIRMECRIGGADLNPYLAFAALIAAGLKPASTRSWNCRSRLSATPIRRRSCRRSRRRCAAATETLAKSKMLKEAFGEDVIEHYVHTGELGAARI